MIALTYFISKVMYDVGESLLWEVHSIGAEDKSPSSNQANMIDE